MSTVSGLGRGGRRGGPGVTVSGADELKVFLHILAVGLPLGLGFQLVEEGEEIMKISRPHVPVEDYDLVNSGDVSNASFTAGYSEVLIGYGGPAVKRAGRGYDYSLIQHDPQKFGVSYSRQRGGMDKFLEVPAIAHGYGAMKGNMEKALIKLIKDFM